MTALTKSISVSQIIGTSTIKQLAKDMPLDSKSRKKLMRIVGIVLQHKQVDGKFNLQNVFKGNFKSTNFLKDNEEKHSATLYAPTMLDDMLVGALASKPAESNENVAFGVDVFMVEDSSSAVGYNYEISLIGDLGASDPLDALEQKLLSSANKNDAPTETPEATPEKTAKKSSKKK